jgi:prepilin-type N-terminal cleavage/methylation domain-containing protein
VGHDIVPAWGVFVARWGPFIVGCPAFRRPPVQPPALRTRRPGLEEIQAGAALSLTAGRRGGENFISAPRKADPRIIINLPLFNLSGDSAITLSYALNRFAARFSCSANFRGVTSGRLLALVARGAKAMTSPTRPASAFTLIELLVTVGILTILAAIAIPNYLEAHTRAKVAKVKAELRTVAIAVDTFETDHGEYPASRLYPCPIHPKEASSRPTDWLANFHSLTTPIAYLPKVNFIDPFIKPRQRHKHLWFGDPTVRHWHDPGKHDEPMPAVAHDIIYCPPEDPRDRLARDPQYTYMLAVSKIGYLQPEKHDVDEFDGETQGKFEYFDRTEDSEVRRPYYFVSAVGPDGVSGPDAISGKLWTSYNYTWGNDATQRNVFNLWQYDPTNGTVSGGDLFRYFTE